MNLSTGILAIGSVYWENNVREKWRQLRLKMDDVFSVSVPIRYGRLSTSEKRKNTYTMVFSSGLKQLGRAKVISCINHVSSVSDLVHEAELLWAAELNKSQPDGTLSRNWGCVALLLNPRRDIQPDLLTGWANRISRENNYGQLAHTPEEGPLVIDRGLLQIPWPEMVGGGGPLPLDLVLATANEPTLEGNPPDYPCTKRIALAWKKASEKYPSGKHADYFWNNKRNGITTFQDDAIERILQKPGGCLRLLRLIFKLN